MPHMRVQGPGEGWIDIFGADYQWMQIAYQGSYDLQQADTPLPTVAPGDVATAEACFRRPDGYIVCILRSSLEYGNYQRAYGEEVPQSAPDFIPPAAPVVVEQIPPTVVPSPPSEPVPANEDDVAIDWGTVIGGVSDIYNAYTDAQSQVFNYVAGTGTQLTPAPPMYSTVTTGGSCGCNSNPCVCGTINGRPALVDPRTGKRCYRRRRRVMLTEGDFNTLLRIATLPNNANVRTALAKAIGRR